jgi:hypothetical protein
MGGGGGKAGQKIEINEDFEIAIHSVIQGFPRDHRDK